MNTRIGNIAQVFKHRNYRIFFLGMSVSLAGTWMSSVALSWLVYRITDSSLMLGLISFASQFMMIAISPFSGVLIDRFDRKKLLFTTQLIGLAISFTLAGLIISGVVTVWQIVVMSILRGAVTAFDVPARHAIAASLIEDQDDLPKAIALNSAMFNGARLVGPALGGLIIAEWGEGICFILDAISFLPSAISILMLNIPRHPHRQHHSVLNELLNGLRYAYDNRSIRTLLLALAAGSLMGASYLVLLPVFVRDVFQSGPRMFGLLTASSGCGAFFGALALASRFSNDGLGKLAAQCFFGMAFGTIALAIAPSPWVAMVALFLSGVVLVTFTSSCNTMIQIIAPDEKRGRMMSLYTLSFVGMMPLGSLLGGALSHWLGGARMATGLTGLACLVAALLFTRPLLTIDRKP